MEQACRARAEEVCIQLTNDYEAKVAQVRPNQLKTKISLLCGCWQIESYGGSLNLLGTFGALKLPVVSDCPLSDRFV